MILLYSIFGGSVLVAVGVLIGRLTATVHTYKNGIRRNPPTMIETAQQEPLNIKIDDKRHIAMSDLSFVDVMKNVQTVQRAFYAIGEFEKLGDYKDKQKDVTVFARLLIGSVWEIVKPHVKGKKQGAEKAFYKKSLTEFSWFIDNVVTEILDYWMLTKKKMEILQSGATPRQTYGVDFSWNLLRLDGDGKLYAVPRYV